MAARVKKIESDALARSDDFFTIFNGRGGAVKEETFQRVAEFADRILFEQDRVVTAHEVKVAIGGGTDQVRQAHAAWMAGLAHRLHQTESVPELPPALAKALVEAWRQSVDAAREQAHAAWGEHEKRADARVAEAEQAGLALRAKVEAKEEDLTDAHHRLEQADAMRRTREAELAAERARVDAAQRHAQELREAAERAAHQAQSQFTSLREQLGLAHARHDAVERRLVAQLDEQKRARADLEQQLTQNETQWRAFEKDMQTRYMNLSETHVRLQSEGDAHQKHLTVLTHRLLERDAQTQSLLLEQAVLTQKLETLNTAHSHLLAAHQAAQETIAGLQTELLERRLEQRLWERLTLPSEPKT